MPQWFFKNEEEIKAFKAIDNDSDRGAALIAVGFVEQRLEERLRYFLRSDEHAETVLKEMFGGFAPLGSFSAKIRMGFLLRFFGRRAYKELNAIKDIRNKFAHHLRDLSFSTQEIADKCKTLKLVENYFQPMSEVERLKRIPGMSFGDVDEFNKHLAVPRTRFIETCGLYVSVFGYGNFPIIIPIHGDDRPNWPEVFWQLRPLR